MIPLSNKLQKGGLEVSPSTKTPPKKRKLDEGENMPMIMPKPKNLRRKVQPDINE